MENFSIFPLQHRGMNCTCIRLLKDDWRNAIVRKLPHIRWSATHRCWYAPETEALKRALNEIFFVVEDPREEHPAKEQNAENNVRQHHPAKAKPAETEKRQHHPATEIVETDLVFPNAEDQLFVERFRRYLQVRNYAQETINNYVPALIHFLKYFHGRDVRKLNEVDLENYQMRSVVDKGLSHSYQNTLVSVVKLFYESVIGKQISPEFISRPRRERPLPKIMSMEEVSTLLHSVKNQKHRMMLALIYACGLRSGELISMRFADIQSSRMMIHIKAAKGNKDRLVPLSQKLLDQLREYYKIFRPKEWLFEGQYPGERYAKRSLQLVMKQALKSAGLSSAYRLHDLRHSYATHQLEAGTNEHIIQKLLGHSSIKTTTIYTKVARTTLEKVYNPFDHLDL